MSAKRKPVPLDRLRMPKAGHETLERLKRWPALRRNVMEDAVLIWSGEHRCYWREGGSGYVAPERWSPWMAQAWVLTIDEAIEKTRHCGPEKQIEFHSLF